MSRTYFSTIVFVAWLIATAFTHASRVSAAPEYTIVALPTPVACCGFDYYAISAINDSDVMAYEGGGTVSGCGLVNPKKIFWMYADSYCEMDAINNKGYAVGAYLFEPPPEFTHGIWATLDGVQGGTGKFAGFASINDLGQATGTEPEPYYSGAGIFDIYTGVQLAHFSDPLTGCTAYTPMFITSRGEVFASADCPGQPPLVVISGSRYQYLTPPNDLIVTRVNNNKLIALNSQSTGALYLWPSPWTQPPVKLGHLPGSSSSAYYPVGLNDHDVMVGSDGAGTPWIWDRARGFRYFEKLLPKNTYGTLYPYAINNRGDVGAQVSPQSPTTFFLLRFMR